VKANTYQPNQPNHKREKLERVIRRLERDVLTMGALVEESFRCCHQALCCRDLTVIEAPVQLDKKIDGLYRQIESDCTTTMALYATTVEDLRCLSAFMQLVRDLERIGDYAKDIAEIALKIFPYPPHPVLPEIALMSDHAQSMLAISLVALADLDEISGKSIKVLDDTVDNAYEDLYKILVYQQDASGGIEPIVLLVLAIRYLERMADHATNIGQRVAYIVTGQRE
jgi:phosphate transport system protein